MLTVADIYSGGGGLSAGFDRAAAWWDGNDNEGYDIVYGVDRDGDAIETFRKFHFSGLGEEELCRVAPCKDIDDITSDDILKAIFPHKKVDVLIGGPNCQGVSAAGLRNPDDHRNKMLKKFIELVRELTPSWFVIENVPGLTHKNNHELLAEIFKELESIEGYKVRGDILLAADYGVPQFRYRLFIIGTNTDSPIRFPSATHTPAQTDVQPDLLEIKPIYRTVRQAIGDLEKYKPKIYDRNSLPDEVGNSGVPPNHHYVDIGPANKNRIAKIPPGKDWRSMPLRLLPERYFATRCADQKGAYGRLLWDWPAYTITNAVCNVTAGPFTHPDFDRVLTVREAARLQSFGDEHFFYGNLESQYRQIGNAVPPYLAEAIANAILFSHHCGDLAKDWGRPGRLNYELIRNSLDLKIKFPTLIQRHVAPDTIWRKTQRQNVKPHSKKKTGTIESAWESAIRPPDPHRDDTRRLRQLAKQPGNYRAAKRARAIVNFIDGMKKAEIVAKTNVSEVSVKRWVDGYYNNGLDGWRAHHTLVGENCKLDGKLADKIRKATVRVRKTLLAPTKNDDVSKDDFKRLYMNSYLVSLIDKFGNKSVEELTELVEKQLGSGIGTMYVGDLLALCDVVLQVEDFPAPTNVKPEKINPTIQNGHPDNFPLIAHSKISGS
jgi:DNA-cytosine methyltransferase